MVLMTAAVTPSIQPFRGPSKTVLFKFALFFDVWCPVCARYCPSGDIHLPGKRGRRSSIRFARVYEEPIRKCAALMTKC